MDRLMGAGLAGALACMAAPAAGFTAGPEDPEDPEDVTWVAWKGGPPPTPAWRLGFEPTVRYAAPSGEVRLAGTPVGVRRTDIADLNLDSPRLSPEGTVTVRGGPWRLSAGAFTAGIDSGATATAPGQVGGLSFSAGERLRSELRLTSLEATAGYRFFEARRGRSGDSDRALTFGLDAIGGLRAHRFELEVIGQAGRVAADEWFVEPIVGGAVGVELWERVGVDLRLTFGAGGGYDDKSSGSADLMLGFEYGLADNIGLRVGYRTMVMGLSADDGEERFKFLGSVAGLSVGVMVRF